MEAIPTLVLLAIAAASVVVWVVALVSVLRTPGGAFRTGSKGLWLLVVLFGQLVGAVVYLGLGRPQARD